MGLSPVAEYFEGKADFSSSGLLPSCLGKLVLRICNILQEIFEVEVRSSKS